MANADIPDGVGESRQRNDIRNDSHLPECGHGRLQQWNDGSASINTRCICSALRACEQRVLERIREAISWVQDMDEALDVIVALREWPEPTPLPPSVGVPTAPMWPLRGES